MKRSSYRSYLNRRVAATVTVLAGTVIAGLLLRSSAGQGTNAGAAPPSATATNAHPSEATIELQPGQLGALRIEPTGTFSFPVEKEAVGTISFVDDLNVQVFPSYQGKLLQTFVQLGDEVKKGQPLYTIDSPDLVQAESTLIGAAAVLELTSKELARAKGLFGTNGVSEREVEQASSDQQTAEGALKAARDAVRVFGKTEGEIDKIVGERKIDPALVVPSPVGGQITAMIAPPGLLVQPGNGPAPYAVAVTSVKWMLANVVESESPFFRVGQAVAARVMAWPGRVFQGKISKIYAAVDPNTHRVTVRSEIEDPKNELRAGMLASFVIRVAEPVESVALPAAGVVRNGDGTMVAWVTTDRRRFAQRLITVGLEYEGRRQVLAGLRPGELAVTEGGIFLNYMLQAPATD
jgi:cobalt-zinc-cadmium efflux system membrane fusion protein